MSATTTEITIIDIDKLRAEPAPLYHRFDGQLGHQRAFIEIDAEARTVRADYSGEVGDAVPMSVWNGMLIRVSVPARASGPALAGWLEHDDTLALIERIIAGWSCEHDGANWRGRLSDDAQEGADALESAAYRLERADIYPVEDYLADMRTAARWATICLPDGDATIVATTSDEELERIAQRVVGQSQTEGILLDGDARQIARMLERIRDGLLPFYAVVHHPEGGSAEYLGEAEELKDARDMVAEHERGEWIGTCEDRWASVRDSGTRRPGRGWDAPKIDVDSAEPVERAGLDGCYAIYEARA